jgi:beta-lactamase class A
MIIMKRKTTVFITLFVAFLATVSFSYKTYAAYQNFAKDQAALDRKKTEWLRLKKTLEKKVRSFHGTVGLVIEDLDTGWEISFNKTTLIPSASLVKVPVMLACFYAEQEKKACLKDCVSLRSSHKVAGSKVLGNDPPGSVYTVEELFDPMITQSDNAAANLLIDYMGFDSLNSYFKKMGLKNTNISRRMMDFAERSEGAENYTTAEDMAYLLEGLYRGKFLNKEVSQRCMQILGDQKINDRIPRKLPKGTYVVHKTGLERHICHDAGIVFTGKGDFLICVLVKHGNKVAKTAKKFISNVTLLTYNLYQSQ